jgi:putative SOS response-associated peptidase YedK
VCGRFTLTARPEILARDFELEAVPQLAPRFNVAPGQDVATVWWPRAGGRELQLRRWGLVPGWAREPRIGSRLVNARAESAAERPAFRDALRLRRCLVPADGFYEWADAEPGREAAAQRAGSERRAAGPGGRLLADRQLAAGRPAGSGPRQPYYVGLADRGLFAIAGLFERWRREDGTLLETCVLLTVPANDRIRPLHDRMPAILGRRDWALWLDPQVRDPRRVQALLVPWTGPELELHAVSRRVNQTEHDDPACIAPLA